MQFISYIFAAMFIGLFACLLLAVGYGISTVIFAVIRLFYPRFAILPIAEGIDIKTDQKEVKRLAIDYVMAERLRRQRALKQRVAEIEGVALSTLNGSDEMSWDLSALKNIIHTEKIRSQVENTESKRTEDQAQYSLIRYPEGQSQPRYLCTKLSQRGVGLRVAFASLAPEKRIRLDYVSAMRLAEAIGPDVLIAPANAAARITVKRKGVTPYAKHATA